MHWSLSIKLWMPMVKDAGSRGSFLSWGTLCEHNAVLDEPEDKCSAYPLQQPGEREGGKCTGAARYLQNSPSLKTTGATSPNVGGRKDVCYRKKMNENSPAEGMTMLNTARQVQGIEGQLMDTR